AMGLLRHVGVYPAEVTDGQDIHLDIPLDRDLPVRLLNAPGGPEGPNDHSVRISLDLGSDGSLRLWPAQSGLDKDHFVFRHLPRDFNNALEGSTIQIRAQASTQSPNQIPYSASMERDWALGRSPAVARIQGDAVELLDPDFRPDATGGCGLAGGGGIVFSPGGRAWNVDASGNVFQMQSLSFRTLRACSSLKAGGVLAVGDNGSIVRWDGSFAVQETAPTSRRLNAVDIAPDGTEFAAGDGVLLMRAPGAEWQTLDYGSKAPLNAVVTAADSTAMAVGDGGLVVRIRDNKATPLLPYPTSQDIIAATPYGWGVLMVGSHGVSILGGFDGGFIELETPFTSDILTILAQADGTVLAAGAAGRIMRYQDGIWAELPSLGFTGEAKTLLPGADGSAIVLSGDVALVGPFLHLPIFSSPPQDGLWSNLTLQWTRDSPPEPSMTYSRLYGPKSSREWSVLGSGSIDTVHLPDLAVAAAPFMEVSPLPSGEVRLHSIQMLIDHFDFNAFDANAFSMSQWRSWTVDEFGFLKP
ncbi:MAG: hypothetical protein GXP54_04210, partial [Deltaproteobacteria bacterium]|nr:hypothetical protein [Deltaproteobacteria bacterium]